MKPAVPPAVSYRATRSRSRDNVLVTSVSVQVVTRKRACEHQRGSRLGLSGMFNKCEYESGVQWINELLAEEEKSEDDE